MGSLFSSVLDRFWKSQEVRILVLGLDGAGKTTILYQLQCGEVVTTVPMWDLGGQTSIRPYWRCYYQNTNGIIYVVDSADTQRLGISKEELYSMMEEEELKNAALLVLANKQDLPGALDAEQISDALGLSNLKDRQWQIFRASAINGVGLHEGLDWMVNALNAQGRS